MERLITVTLKLQVEVDGTPPPDADLFDEIGREIADAIPGVLCLMGQEEYALPVQSISIEVTGGSDV